VRRVRHQDLGARRVATRDVISADHGHAREFALRAGHGRETHSRHASHVFQYFLQLEHARQKTLPGFGGRIRVAR